MSKTTTALHARIAFDLIHIVNQIWCSEFFTMKMQKQLKKDVLN